MTTTPSMPVLMLAPATPQERTSAKVIKTHFDGEQFFIAAFWHKHDAEEFAEQMNQTTLGGRYSVVVERGEYRGGAR